jgi:pimeloyl-ACP methyl ester carboxylesterase
MTHAENARTQAGAVGGRGVDDSVTVPSLVAYGSKSRTNLQKGSRAPAEVLPNAELRELEGQSHNVSTKVLVPVLGEFFAGKSGRVTRADEIQAA